jgi:outer membrane protein OmpA-like peptidoglycan-associated protein
VAERTSERLSEWPESRDPDAELDDDLLSELRSLIVGPEQRELLALRSRLLDPEVQTREVSRVLPEAILLRGSDPELTHALTPSIEEAVTASVRRDPAPLADALFPVMGPAIRKAIGHALASMMESLNRTVEHSVSLRAARWRWTAFQTGKPFAEIVLLNTLQYRVEQVFLVHAETGLLLQQVSADPNATQDADQISAMLTAIRDFVRDSFHTPTGDTLDALRVGELTVIVEPGPHAFLAGVVRGTPPRDLQVVFQDALERIHRQAGREFETFQGDASPFERARHQLELCLVTQFREQRGKSFNWWWAIGAAAVVAVISVWAGLALRDRQRWNSYLDRLRDEPGIVVTSNGRRGGRFYVAGLRDSLAVDPATLVAASNLAPDAVDARWEPYQSLAPRFVIERARSLLRPPAGVSLDFREGVLTASGVAPDRWIVESERLAPAIGGVQRFAYAGTSPELRLKQQLESMALQFVKGQSRLAPGQDQALSLVADTLRELNEVVRARGQKARVEIVGHTDSDGSDLANEPLSLSRAQTVRQLLHASTLDSVELTVKGAGSALPLSRGTTEADMARNRRASFRVELADGTAQGSDRS